MVKQYKCSICGKELNALNMSDNDDICQDCEKPILDKLFNDDLETTLVLWENKPYNYNHCVGA